MKLRILALMTLLAAPLAARADELKSLAKDFSAAAGRAGVKNVAVLPFEPADSSRPRDGVVLSERLVTRLVRVGRVKAVERAMLGRLMDEHRLGLAGATSEEGRVKLGRLASADALVSGSFVTLGRDAILHARLVAVETGEILAAGEARVEKDWFEEGSRWTITVPAPEFLASAPELPRDMNLDLRDAPADVPSETAALDRCADAAQRIDDLERSILDLKARYWALRLRDGLSGSELKSNPGSTIHDPALKRAFYERMKFWHESPEVPPLSEWEIQQFISIDRQAYTLHQECRF